MRISAEEFRAEINADRSRTELLRMSHFISFSYEEGLVRSLLRSANGHMLNNGEFRLEGNVRYQEFDVKGVTTLSMSSAKAVGSMQVANPSQNFFDTRRSLETVFMPETVLISMKDDLVTTQALTLTTATHLLETSASVSVVGPGRTLFGKGFVYNVVTQQLSMGGPIHGNYIPHSDAVR